MYWAAALSFRLFGVNEFGARFPSAVAATICVFLIYWGGRRLWGPTVGFFSAIITASSVGIVVFARAASMDMLLAACLTAALVFFLVGVNEKKRKRRWFYLFYAALGLGALAKGPVAFFLPAVSLFFFLWIRGTWNEWRSWHPEGLLIGLAVALPWYIVCTFANGLEFIQTFFINHNIERFVSTIHGHQRPFYFYLPVLLLLTFPWTFLLIPTLRRHFARTEQLIGWWAVVPFVFFSLSGSKLPGYILPVVPPIALLCGKELLLSRSRAFKVAAFIEAGTMAFIGVGFGFFGAMLSVDPHVGGDLIAIISFVLAIVISVIAMWLTPRYLALFNVIAIVAIVLIATSFIFPRFDRTDTMRPWEEALEQVVPKEEVVFMYRPTRWMEYGLQFYRSNNARGIGSPEELSQAIVGQSRVLCIAEDKALDELTKSKDLDIQVVHTIGNQTAFWAFLVK